MVTLRLLFALMPAVVYRVTVASNEQRTLLTRAQFRLHDDSDEHTDSPTSIDTRLRNIIEKVERWSADELNFILKYVKSEIGDVRARLLTVFTDAERAQVDESVCKMLNTLIPPASEQLTYCGTALVCVVFVRGLLGDMYRYHGSHCSVSQSQRMRDEDLAVICYAQGLDSAKLLYGRGDKHLMTSVGIRLKRNLAIVLHHQVGNGPLALSHLEEILRVADANEKLFDSLSEEVRVNVDQCRMLVRLWKRTLSDEEGFEIL